MSPLSPQSARALDRLRAYVPPPTIYNQLPASRRAAVLILLFADRRGDLRVVLTLRSELLRSFAGQVALPGGWFDLTRASRASTLTSRGTPGKADTSEETAVQTARREAFEEIGLPLDSQPFPPFSVEHLTEMPCSLARTKLGVRPCIAFLRDNSAGQRADVEDNLIPRLDPKEVSSVFTVPLERFLMVNGQTEEEKGWYQGGWLTTKTGNKWSYAKPGRAVLRHSREERWHEFQAPVWEKTTLQRYRVWGMTARIMVDAARIAYGRDPDFVCNSEIGDEEMVRHEFEEGNMPDKQRKPDPEVQPKEAVEAVKKGNL